MARVVSKAAKRREQQGGVTGTEFGFDLDEAEAQDAATAGLPPDWLTSGVAGAGAGWVFGPVGGLIGLTVAAVLSKRRRDGIMAQVAADIDTGESMLGSAQRQLDEAMSIAKTDQDKAEIAMRQEQLEQIAPLMQHPSPQVRLSGFQSLLQLGTDLSGEMDEIEKAQLDREAVERAEFTTEVGRADGIRDDVQREGSSFAIRQDAYERMLAVDDSAAGDQVLLVNAFKMVDPNSAVLPGEAATAANTAGIPDALVTSYNVLLRGGERLTKGQRADLIRQAGLQYGVARSDQVDRNTAAIERGRAQDIRPDLLNQVVMPVKSQDELPYATPPRDDDTVATSLAGPVAGVDLPVALRDKFGENNPNEVTQPDGSVVRRVDRGQGRFEWVEVEPATPPAAPEAPDILDFSDEAREARRLRREVDPVQPGLFQEGGFFDRGRRETN